MEGVDDILDWHVLSSHAHPSDHPAVLRSLSALDKQSFPTRWRKRPGATPLQPGPAMDAALFHLNDVPLALGGHAPQVQQGSMAWIQRFSGDRVLWALAAASLLVVGAAGWVVTHRVGLGHAQAQGLAVSTHAPVNKADKALAPKLIQKVVDVPQQTTHTRSGSQTKVAPKVEKGAPLSTKYEREGFTFKIFSTQDILGDQVTSLTQHIQVAGAGGVSKHRRASELQGGGVQLLEAWSQLARIERAQRWVLKIHYDHNQPIPVAEKIVAKVCEEANEKTLDPSLLLALIQTESGFNNHAVSSSGARGLTQVLPKWHPEKLAALKMEGNRAGLSSVEGNIRVGAQILRQYLDQSNGHLVEALQRYNGSLDDPRRAYSRRVLSRLPAWH